MDPAPKDEVRSRLLAALLGGEGPSERTVALIALLNATGKLAGEGGGRWGLAGAESAGHGVE